jgi:hypothetical protein
MFNLAIDSKLRGCDVVAIKVDDVAAGGYTADRATVRQKKTGRPVRFELTEQTRQAVDEYLKAANKKPGEFLFAGRRRSPKKHHHTPICAPGIGLDRQCRAGSEAIWDAFTATHQSDPDLSAHGKSQSGPASARAHQDRLCPASDYVPSRRDAGRCQRERLAGPGHSPCCYRLLRKASSLSSGRYRPGVPLRGVTLSRTRCFSSRLASK